jgi:hypothetical protein
LHIGCNNYFEVGNDELYKDVKESHNEVRTYANFFKNELEYDPVTEIIDDKKLSYELNLKNRIDDQLQSMLNKCDGKGNNPFVVNVITYSGHGITHESDAIAVVPEYQNKAEK